MIANLVSKKLHAKRLNDTVNQGHIKKNQRIFLPELMSKAFCQPSMLLVASVNPKKKKN